MNANGTLSFQEPDDVSNREFWRDGDEEMDMIGTGVPFEYFGFLLFGEFSDNFADLDPDGTEQNLLPVLWYDNDVVLAVPHRVIL